MGEYIHGKFLDPLRDFFSYSFVGAKNAVTLPRVLQQLDKNRGFYPTKMPIRFCIIYSCIV